MRAYSRNLLFMILALLLLPIQNAFPQDQKHFVAESGIVSKMAEASIPTPSEGIENDQQSIFPSVWCTDISDEKTRNVCWSAYRAGLEYYSTGLDHRSRIFKWQHLSTRIIFFIVNGLVIIGVYFAWVQFKRDMQSSTKDATSKEEHEVELTTSGIKIRSSVLGVIILTLSLAFFYLYLVFVYPIKEIF